jgi:transcriptional regulator with XRE-family HTH domain
MDEGRKTMSEDIDDRIMKFIDGDDDRPTFDDLAEPARSEALARLNAIEAAFSIDYDRIPSFDEDPVAVRLGYRSGSPEARVYGPTIQARRTEAGMSLRELAQGVSERGYTIDEGTVAALEASGWKTVTSALADAVADFLGINPRELTRADTTAGMALARAGERVVEQHDQLTVARAKEPLGEQFPERLVASFLDLRILLVVCTDDTEFHEAVSFAQRAIVNAAHLAAIGAVRDTEDLDTVLVEPKHALDGYHGALGEQRSPKLPTEQPLDVAIAGLITGQIVRWPRFELDRSIGDDGLSREILVEESELALSRVQKRARRVAEDRRPAYATITDTERAGVVEIAGDVLSPNTTLSADDVIAAITDAAMAS